MGELRDIVLAYLAAVDALGQRGTRGLQAADVAFDALRAAVATPPDMGWQNTPPTVEQVTAHREAHPSPQHPRCGLWMVHGGDIMPTVVPMRPDDEGDGVVAYVLAQAIRLALLGEGEQNEPGYEWRPLTARGDPAPRPRMERLDG